MRSLATRQSNLALSAYVKEAIQILKAANFDLIILETSGIGQSDTEILDHSDVSLVCDDTGIRSRHSVGKNRHAGFCRHYRLNKFDKRGALDALRDVKKQYQRNHQLWDKKPDDMPVFGTIASQFNDPGTNQLYKYDGVLKTKTGATLNSSFHCTHEMSEKIFVIPPNRTRYMSEIAEESAGMTTGWKNKQT